MYCMCKMTIMDERELIRYIAGEGTPEERAKVLDWVEESQEHRKRFNGLKNAWVMAHLPQGRASRRNVPWREERRSGGWRSMWVGYGVAASLVLLLAFGLWEREKQHEADIAFLEGQEMARMVSETLSPLAAELESAEEKPSTLPPKLNIADSKLSRVRVLGS